MDEPNSRLNLEELKTLSEYLEDVQKTVVLLCIFCGISILTFSICVAYYAHKQRKIEKKIDKIGNLLCYHELEEVAERGLVQKLSKCQPNF